MQRRITAVLALALTTTLTLFAAKTPAKPAGQRMDEEYTKLIKQYLSDPRITTELVDHMPA
ncbi:MAG: hypothetical protein JO041_10340, partial [Acidobacteria bacterium]|nr:hypothetical protein [Acidobacteriota bacterium]